MEIDEVAITNYSKKESVKKKELDLFEHLALSSLFIQLL